MTIKDLQTKYSLPASDFWELSRGGRSVWIITHDAIEKIMAIENIEVDYLDIISSEWNFCRIKVSAAKKAYNDDGDTYTIKSIITIGEALLTDGRVLQKTNRHNQPIPLGNCESQYIGAMAEKRGIDRAVLKLINAYEYGIYSDVESDSFKKEGK